MENNLKSYIDNLVNSGLNNNYWFMTKQSLSNFYLPLFITRIVDTYPTNHYPNENFARFYKRCFEEDEYAKSKFPKQSDGENRYRNAIIGEFLGLFSRNGSSSYADGAATEAYKVLKKYIQHPEDMQTYQYLIDRQIEKLYLNNPISSNYDVLKEIKIFPVIFLYKVLLELDAKFGSSIITYDEFLLFVVHSKQYEDWKDVIELIDQYRNDDKDSIKDNINLILSHETMQNIRFDGLFGILKNINYQTKKSFEISSLLGSKEYIETVVDLYEHSDFNNSLNSIDCVKFMQSDRYFIGKLETVATVQLSSLEKDFKNWLNVARREDTNELYTHDSKEKYLSNLKLISQDLGFDIFAISNISSAGKLIKSLSADQAFIEKNQKCKNSYSCALKIYERFLNEYFKDRLETTDDFRDIFEHNLYGIHIKNKNDALSLENPHICIGWSYLGDLSNYNEKDDLRTLFESKSPESSKNSVGQCVGQIWRFIKEARIGDYVILGENNYIHIGRITSGYEYSNEVREEQDPDYVNSRKVEWLKTNINRSELSETFHHSIGSAMSFFTLNDYRSAVVDLLNDKYIKDEPVVETEETLIDENLRVRGGTNAILYGVPGAGKSWTIKSDYCDDEDMMERLVFHPDYTYSDFVGQILPKLDENGNVTYVFTPGPFTKLLRKAYRNPTNMYFLIIEEVNRGNAPAIFGDIFQLLDRNENGDSDYKITNADIAKVVYDDENHKVTIPSNMTIVCTMNTSDQNVFTLDTAFQRRWSMRLIKNKFHEDEPKEIKFANTNILDSNVSWEKFFTEINRIILDKNIKMTSSEDKRLGTHFVNEEDLKYDGSLDINGNMTISARLQNSRFPEKVLKYLWDDAFKFTKEDVFDTEKYKSLEDVIDKFLNSTGNERFKVFKENIYNSLIPAVEN